MCKINLEFSKILLFYDLINQNNKNKIYKMSLNHEYEYENEYENDDMVDTFLDGMFQASTIKIYAPVYRDVSTI